MLSVQLKGPDRWVQQHSQANPLGCAQVQAAALAAMVHVDLTGLPWLITAPWGYDLACMCSQGAKLVLLCLWRAGDGDCACGVSFEYNQAASARFPGFHVTGWDHSMRDGT